MTRMITSLYDFEARQIDGAPVPLSQFKGKVLLIVNTASACGYTPQFAGLEELHRSYGAQGLVVLGFPCNQFGEQDPGANEEIAQFCQVNYGVTFPMMAKIDVKGAKAHPLYQWLSAEAPGLLDQRIVQHLDPVLHRRRRAALQMRDAADVGRDDGLRRQLTEVS